MTSDLTIKKFATPYLSQVSHETGHNHLACIRHSRQLAVFFPIRRASANASLLHLPGSLGSDIPMAMAYKIIDHLRSIYWVDMNGSLVYPPGL